MTIALITLQSHWLLWTVVYADFAVNLALDAWLLLILSKQRVRKELPWFLFYVVWEMLSSLLGLGMALLNPGLYLTVYWWKEGVRVALLVAAVRESLLHIFEGLKSLLCWSVSTVIVAVVLYSAWKAVHAPPVQSTRLASFILGAEFAFRWGIVAVALLTMGLMWFVQEPMGGWEDAAVTGCGIASLAFVGTVLIRSFFGTRFLFLTQYLPDVGYFVAVFLWIRVFSRPIPEFGFKELGMQPEQIRTELGRYRELDDRIRRKL